MQTARAPQRLTVIIEGESLFNDGTSVVLFTILLNIATGNVQFDSTAGLAIHVLGSFLLVVLGGLWIAFIGWFLLDAAHASGAQVAFAGGVAHGEPGRITLSLLDQRDLTSFALLP